jgi:probable rRNA maturation factor
MIEVEVFGVESSAEIPGTAPSASGTPGHGPEPEASSAAESPSSANAIPPLQEIRRLCALTAGAAGVSDGHMAIEFVDARRIAELNRRHRDRPKPTDVLSFPIDGAEPTQGERELGDVVICLEHTIDVREAIVHGVLHLLGMDHETDGGEMLKLQRQLLSQEQA